MHPHISAGPRREKELEATRTAPTRTVRGAAALALALIVVACSGGDPLLSSDADLGVRPDAIATITATSPPPPTPVVVEPQNPNELVGTWRVATLGDTGSGDDAASITFSDAGVFTASLVCPDLSGRYVATATSLTLRELEPSKSTCDGNGDGLATLLHSVFGYAVGDGELTLLTQDGTAVQLRASDQDR